VRKQLESFWERHSTIAELALISFASLYFEMIVIRWLASDIRVFTYLKNLPLLAAFLGLGLGCARPRPRLSMVLPCLLCALIAIVAFAQPLDLVHLYFPLREDVWAWSSTPETGVPALLLAGKFFLIVGGLFFLVVALFNAFGQRLGSLFDALPPTRAYSVNLVASLVGIWVFALLSWLEWPHVGWLALGCLALLYFYRHSRPAMALLALVVVLAAVAPAATRWSPYYRIDLSPLFAPSLAGDMDPAGYSLTVNHDYHQRALNLDPAFVESHPETLTPAYLSYELPYRFVQPRRVLVVGAGTGNDVAAALRHGAEHVDAVEIDPAILELGGVHPEQPYASPRVRLVNDDARSYFARTNDEYDLIVFGLLDSHTLLSSMSSLRLDSYVYTLESFAQARAHLAPGGYLSVSFSGSVSGWEWLAGRLYQMIDTTFGEPPVSIAQGYDAGTLHIIGPDVHQRLAADPELAAMAVEPSLLRAPVPPATDDWPFLYLRDHGVPLMPYGVVLMMLLVGGGGLVLVTLRRSLGGLDAPMFLLGAGFMLIEVKSISQVSLLFGSTWIVNALIISAILALALLANLFVARWGSGWLGPAYALLIVALVVDYLVPIGALGGQSVTVKAVLGSLFPVLPLLFAGVIFASLFSRATAPGHAFGSNLLGALCGGLLEYVSMATGFKALALLALALYAASWLVLRYTPLLARLGTSLGRSPEPVAVHEDIPL
jgi:SAM-dependent methyltransferase